MKRITQLDGLRAIAILMVFLKHAFRMPLMWMGVDLFFILSGFLITSVLLNAKEKSLGHYFAHFYERRARRILAPYLLTLLLGGILFGFGWAHHWYFYILLMNFIRPLNIPHPDAFIPLWSLAVEEQFYLMWPFAVYFLTQKQLARFAGFLILLAPILRGALHFQYDWPIYMLTPFRMDLLATGALLCLVYRNRRDWIEKKGAQTGAVLVVIGVAGLTFLAHQGISTYGNSRIGNVFIYEGALFTCLGIMLWALSGWNVQILQLRPVRWIGQISYTIYLVHMSFLLYFGAHFSKGITAILTIVVTVSYAALSWYLLEKRLLGQSKSAKKPATAAA
jgi:peptidoglycan/LPS O-acetylase OafA/YrhL